MGKKLFKNLFKIMLITKKYVNLKLCKNLTQYSYTQNMQYFARFLQLVYTYFSTIKKYILYLLYLSFTRFTHRTTNTTTI